MNSNLQVQLLQTSRKVPGFLRVRVLWALLSIPIIGLPYFKYIYNSYFKYIIEFYSILQVLPIHCIYAQGLLVIGTSKQELLLAANPPINGPNFNALFHILFYVQLYINVNSLQRVTRIHNHNSHDKIVKLGLPQPWLRAICKKYEDWDPAVRLTIIILRGANNEPLPDSCPGAITKVWSSWSRVQKTSTKSHQQNIFVFSEIILIKRLI